MRVVEGARSRGRGHSPGDESGRVSAGTGSAHGSSGPGRGPGGLTTEGAMKRLQRAVTAVGAAVVFVVASGPNGLAQTNVPPEGQTAHLLRGRISGSVVDEASRPLAGVVISALGVTMAMAVSD